MSTTQAPSTSKMEPIKAGDTNTTVVTTKADCSNIKMKQNSSDDNKNVIVIAVIASAVTLMNICFCTFLTRKVYILISVSYQN